MSATQERVGVTSDKREAPAEIDSARFRAAGHALVDRIADLFASLPERPVSPTTTPSAIRARLGDGRLPEEGGDPVALLEEATSILIDHSTFNGHPRFLGYITASAAPIGVLADLLAAGSARTSAHGHLRRRPPRSSVSRFAGLRTSSVSDVVLGCS